MLSEQIGKDTKDITNKLGDDVTKASERIGVASVEKIFNAYTLASIMIFTLFRVV